MATPAIIAITPGVGQLLDAVSLTVGLNTVVRETMVIADPSNATYLATVTSGGALNVADAVIEACITANVLAVSLPTAQITTLTPPSAAAIGTAVAGDLLIGTQVAGSSVPVALPTVTITALTPPTAAAIAAAIVSNPPAVLQGTSPWVVAGNLTHNNAAPTTNNVGVLPALANVAAPTYTEGDQVLLSTDLTGAMRVSITGTVLASNNITEWNTTALGSPTAFGTGPSGNVIGVNAEMFQGASVVGSGNALYVQFPSAQAVTLTSTTITGTVSVTQGTTPWIVAGGGTAGSPGTAVLTVQGIGGGTAIPVSGTFYQATQPVSIASGQVASGAFASGSIASGAIASGAIASGAIAAGAAAAGAFADGTVYVRSNAAATFPVTATIAAAQTIAVTNTGTFVVQAEMEGHAGVALDAVLGATKPANVLQVGGNDGTNAYAIPLAASGTSVVISGSVTATVTSTSITGVVEVAPTGSANTLSNPFFNVLADNSGHALTVNSTATASKYALDTNILSILGTAPTTAGFLDIKGADGNVFVRQTTAANLNATIVGAAASGASAVGNPVLVAGVDGSGKVQNLPVSVESAAVPANVLWVGGKDTNGTLLQGLRTTVGGSLVIGDVAVGADGTSNGSLGVFISPGGTDAPLQVCPMIFNGTTWDRARSAGVGNAVAATGLAASVPYVQYNTTLPAPTAGQYTAAQCDTTGSTYINTEGRKATYSAFASFTAVAGDIAVLPGSASKTIRIIRVEVSFTTSGVAAVEGVQLIKRSAADTGGTSAAMTAVPHDSGFAGASAAPLNYTVAPTPGAAVGAIRGVQFNDASSSVPGANTWIWDFGARPSSAIVLRGVAQMLCVNIPTAIATQTALVSFEWTEE